LQSWSRGWDSNPPQRFFYTAGCGIASAARRLNRSAFGDPDLIWINPGIFPGNLQLLE